MKMYCYSNFTEASNKQLIIIGSDDGFAPKVEQPLSEPKT